MRVLASLKRINFPTRLTVISLHIGGALHDALFTHLVGPFVFLHKAHAQVAGNVFTAAAYSLDRLELLYSAVGLNVLGNDFIHGLGRRKGCGQQKQRGGGYDLKECAEHQYVDHPALLD